MCKNDQDTLPARWEQYSRWMCRHRCCSLSFNGCQRGNVSSMATGLLAVAITRVVYHFSCFARERIENISLLACRRDHSNSKGYLLTSLPLELEWSPATQREARRE